MGKLILFFIVVLLAVVNSVFVTKFISLYRLLVELRAEQNTFTQRGDDFKKHLLVLSTLNKAIKKIEQSRNISLFDAISQKLNALQIPFVTYSEREEKIAEDKKLKVLQFVFNELEIGKLFSFLVLCEKDIPGVKVKLLDITIKDKKIAQKVTVEFIKTITLENTTKS